MAQQLTFKRYNTTNALTSAKTTFKVGDVIFDEEAKIIYVVTKKEDTGVTLVPYYGNNAIKSVSCKSATITVTLSDNTTSSFTVNNVATAGEATKATNDSENNPINTTYFKKSGGTINGATTINGGLIATGETDVESLTAGSLIVNGSTRFNNDVIATTFTGNLKGNANTATSATTASTASSVPWSGITDKPNSGNFISALNKNGYQGLGSPDGTDTDWIRTTSQGLIPYKSGGASALGTSSWPFKTAYINTIYGTLSGNATSATTAGTAAKATSDGAGNNIVNTYQLKVEIIDLT